MKAKVFQHRMVSPWWSLLALVAVAIPLQAERPHIYALQNLRIVTAPGQVIEKGSLVIRDGRIEAVGADISIPEDAQVIEGEEGWTVYAAFIDAAAYIGKKESESQAPSGLSDILASLSKPKEPEKGAPHPIAKVQPHTAVIDWLSLESKDLDKHRKLGFGTAQIINHAGIFRGFSTIINLRDGAVRELVLRDRFAQALAFERGTFFGGAYPGSRMGAVAAVRQALLDAQQLHQWRNRYQDQPTAMRRPPFQDSTQPLVRLLQGEVPLLFVADNPLSYDRFADLKKEFGLGNAMVLGTCEEWRALDRVKAANMPVLLPLNFPKKPELDDEDAIRAVSLDSMQSYLNAPATPARLAALEVPFAIVTAGGSGMGAGAARKLAEDGVRLVIHDLGEVKGDMAPAHGVGATEEMEAVAAEIRAINPDVATFQADMREEAQVAALVAYAVERFGRLDILVNNAGVGYLFGPLVDATQEMWDTVMNVNLRGAFFADAATGAHSPRMVPPRPETVTNRGASSFHWGANGSGLGLVGRFPFTTFEPVLGATATFPPASERNVALPSPWLASRLVPSSATETSVTPPCTCADVALISSAISRDESDDRCANCRTSAATTAKPRPVSPARAASTPAFSASRLV